MWIRAALLLPPAVAVGLLAGCGDDDTSATAGTRQVEAADAPFCDAHAAMVAAMADPEGGDVEGAAEALTASAPADIAPVVETFLDVAGRAAAAGDESLFISSEFRDPLRSMQAFVAEHCGLPVIEVTASDYAFTGVPATLAAGPTMFHLSNDGRDVHEALLFRRSDGVSGDPVALLNADPSASNGDLVEVGVVLIGESGEDAYLSVDLPVGSYVMACFVQQGVTSLDDIGNEGPVDHDHRAAGMVVQFEVD